MTSAGTRKPSGQLLDVRVGLAEVPSAVAQSPTDHGVVAWARSPRIVAEPVEHRRPTLRSIIADRSCASSSDDVPEARRALEQVASLVDQHRVVQRPAGRLPGPSAAAPRAIAPARPCVSSPSAAAARKSGVAEQPHHQPHRVDRGPERVDVAA